MTVISLEERLAKELAGRPLGCTEGRADDIAEEDGETLAELGHMRVVAQGRLSQHSYQAHDGSNRTVMELTVDEIGPSLRYATAQVTKQRPQRLSGRQHLRQHLRQPRRQPARRPTASHRAVSAARNRPVGQRR